MAANWTPDQLTAIKDRGGTLLVSAAAGSGKTAVLVERVIRYILEDGKNIDEFLIVTFTNAAATEMKGKITEAIMQYMIEHPADLRMKKQLYLIHKAQITTVHSFCLNLVRENFNRLDLSPNFRIADERETEILRQEVLETLLDTFYEKAEPGFLLLSNMVSGDRDDRRLVRLVLNLYDKTQSHARPQKYLDKLQTDYTGELVSPAETDWGNHIFTITREMLCYSQDILKLALAQAEEDGVLPYYGEAFSDDLKQIENLLKKGQKPDWDEMREAICKIAPKKLKRASKVDKSITKPLQDLRQIWKDILGKLRKEFYFCSEEEILEDRSQLAPAVCALLQVTGEFSSAFLLEKRKRRIVDFNDLEHFAVELLTEPDGNPTALAKEIHYEAIMVDEYQDTNEAQDTIFRAVSDEEKNIFMVGDVKQSIYRFRMANPMIFLSKYKKFPLVDQVKAGQFHKIILSKNFRSRKEVLDSVNYLFAHVMSEQVGDVIYDDAASLYCGADYPAQPAGVCRTEFCAIDIPRKSRDEEEDSPEKAVLEARYVAARISHMLCDGFQVSNKERSGLRRVTPSDFAILLRSRSKMHLYQKELERVGLSVISETTEGLLACTEVEVMVSLLSVIDNPRQDIPLIGVLRSPLFGFTEKRLAEIRLCREEGDFYDALISASEKMEDAADFLERLNQMRTRSVDLPVHQLLWQLYDQTGALGLYGASPDGKLRQDHLMQLFEIADHYEGQGYKGLFRFVRFLYGMQEQGKDFPIRSQAEKQEGISVMTIHKSKGLEYPVVFLADCAKKFNMTDLYENVQLHENLGIGMKCRDIKRMTEHTTVQRNAIAKVRRRENLSEEMRVLYVAMTRAKEKLIVTGAFSGLEGILKKWAVAAAFSELPSYAISSVQSMGEWLLAALLKHPNGSELQAYAGVQCPLYSKEKESWKVHIIKPEEIAVGPYAREIHREEEREITACPEFIYPYEELTKLPSKLTATGIRNTFRSEEAAEDTPMASSFTMRRPRFDLEEKGLTAAEKGIAHHLAMQFMRYENCGDEDGIRREIQRLREQEILTTAQCDAIVIPKLLGFFQSPLYGEMRQADRIWHEFKFSVLVPVTDYVPQIKTSQEDRILLQGVVDCMYENNEKITILDFKTDHLTHGNREDRITAHKQQIGVYKRAVEEIFHLFVEKCALYYFDGGEIIIL